MESKNKKSDLNKKLDDFLGNKQEEMQCADETCTIKSDKSIMERVNKKIITEDGRQLLF